ncbi:unnamed protein product [Paramecium octaurelia]|uniref:Uncharacterized protein n=1 Tax=Paramecium octaurelia TaxID=43137 RepID=A0A8S1VBB1_PAROT|nr:unnamed protein product [Paramecium octaurelia]
MEVLNIIEEIVDDDLLFIQKYGLLISNFITIFILLYIKSRRQQNDKEERNPFYQSLFILMMKPCFFYLQLLIQMITIYEAHLISNGNANKIGKI